MSPHFPSSDQCRRSSTHFRSSTPQLRNSWPPFTLFLVRSLRLSLLHRMFKQQTTPYSLYIEIYASLVLLCCQGFRWISFFPPLLYIAHRLLYIYFSFFLFFFFIALSCECTDVFDSYTRRRPLAARVHIIDDNGHNGPRRPDSIASVPLSSSAHDLIYVIYFFSL